MGKVRPHPLRHSDPGRTLQIDWVHGEDVLTFAKEERPSGQHAELVFGQHYGDHAPVLGLRSITIPKDYLQSNYQRYFALYLLFFVIPLLIVWYYCVTKCPMYAGASFPTTALLVRVPLLFAGFFVGSVFYIIAQVCIITAYTFGISSKAGSSYSIAGLVLIGGIVFNSLHAGFWIAQVTTHAHLMAFTQYAVEASTGQIATESWTSNLITPLLVYFLSIEPITTAVAHTMTLGYVYMSTGTK